MYRFFLLIILVLTFSVAAKENVFKGSWKLVSGEYLDNSGRLIQYKDLKKANVHSIQFETKDGQELHIRETLEV